MFSLEEYNYVPKWFETWIEKHETYTDRGSAMTVVVPKNPLVISIYTKSSMRTPVSLIALNCMRANHTDTHCDAGRMLRWKHRGMKNNESTENGFHGFGEKSPYICTGVFQIECEACKFETFWNYSK